MTTAGSTFRTNEPMLRKLLDLIQQGAIQLPDFQRGWVWDDNHIRALLASISLSYPIGAVMFLETGDNNIRFKPRLVEGVNLAAAPDPTHLILDGQQRLTSMYLALSSGRPVPTQTDKGQKIERLYYLDMACALDPEADRLDAIISLPPDRLVRSDFGRKIELDVSNRTQEYELSLFPVTLLFDIEGRNDWRKGFQKHFSYRPDKIEFYDAFEDKIWQRFYQYQVPMIELVKGTPKEAVCQVFEQVNTGGVTLSVFELVTATFAADDFQLREDWNDRQQRLHSYDLLQSVDATAFLTAVTLLTSYQRHLSTGGAVSCKRKDVLKLSLAEYQRTAGEIERGLNQAAQLLAREKVFDMRALPYSTQLIPLSAMCAALGKRFDSEPVKQKLVRWYWCGVFGELYGGANESRFAFDLPEVLRWIEGGDEPRTVRDATFTPLRLLSLQTRLSAAYKGVMALLMQKGSRDFQNGDPIELTTYFDQAVDIHHLFPADYCTARKLPRAQWNSIINKAPLTSGTNRSIGKDAPSLYLARIEKKHNMSPAQLDAILHSHAVDPISLRQNDFPTFCRNRAIRLLDLIEAAMGKPIPGRDAEEVVVTFGEALINRKSSLLPTIHAQQAV